MQHYLTKAYLAAMAAEAVWEKHLRAESVNRWSEAAAGKVGTLLHAAYMGKVDADDAFRTAFERHRTEEFAT